MRTTEERLSAMHERAEQLEYKKNVRKTWAVTAGAIAASFAIIVSVAFAIPSVIDRAQGFTPDESMSASVFASGSMLGFVVIGILAFVLGISVTILCYRIKRYKKHG